MNLEMLGKYRSLAREKIGKKGIVSLEGGWKFYGSDYNYQVTKGTAKDKLLIKEEGRI